MPILSGAEIKVVLYICRRTFGFRKDSDTISLNQIASGITKKDGSILDGGTGLSKRHVQRALKTLEEKNIIRVTRQSDDTGLNEINIYSLNILDTQRRVETLSPYPRDKMSTGVETPVSTTTNSKQEIVEQHDDVVMASLQNFGIAKSVATKLAKTYPEQYIRDKLEFTEYLVSTEASLVKKNPAGFLRRAIEEDYEPPKDFETTSQRQARESRQQKTTQAAAEQRRRAEEEFRLAREQAKQHLLGQHPPQLVGEDGLDTQSAWSLTLEKLQNEVPKPAFETWLKDTLLLNVAGNTAHVMVPSKFAGEWLERRMYQSIARTLGNVLQQEVGVEFVAAQPAS